MDFTFGDEILENYKGNLSISSTNTNITLMDSKGDIFANSAIKILPVDLYTISATPNSGYTLTTLTINGVNYSNGGTYKLNFGNNINIVANSTISSPSSGPLDFSTCTIVANFEAPLATYEEQQYLNFSQEMSITKFSEVSYELNAGGDPTDLMSVDTDNAILSFLITKDFVIGYGEMYCAFDFNNLTIDAVGQVDGVQYSWVGTFIILDKTDGGNELPDMPSIDPDSPEIGTKTLATFEFGPNGSANHVEAGEILDTYSESVGQYTLNIDGTSTTPSDTTSIKVYKATDAYGNSCIKLGTSSKVGVIEFDVPENVTEVKLHIAKYKDKDSNVMINNVTHNLTKNSDDGEYDIISIDTSYIKTIRVETILPRCRCMINTIEFIGYDI